MKKSLALLLVALLLVSFAAGCGKSEPAKPATPAQPAKAEPIIIAYTPWNGYGALFVAARQGLFKAKGLDVQIQSIEDVGAVSVKPYPRRFPIPSMVLCKKHPTLQPRWGLELMFTFLV